MSYVTYDDIVMRVGPALLVQLTDDEGTGEVNVDVVDEAADGAVGEVHSHLAHRYAVPIDPERYPHAVSWLRSLVLDLVEHRLHARRPPMPVSVTARREAAVVWLERLAAGAVDLPADTSITAAPGKGLRAATAGDERTVSRQTLRDY